MSDAEILIRKGKAEFNGENFERALKFFEASKQVQQTEEAEKLIKICKHEIEKRKSNSSNGNDHKRAYSEPKKAHEPAPTTPGPPSGPIDEKEQDCLNLINKKDYYEILGVSKTANEDDLRKSYKKLAIKYHPDKNQSPSAEAAFKKISHAFNILNDKEKREFYDKYGTEEEFREKYARTHNRRQYDMDEMDPFDLFEMFFTGGNGRFDRRGRGFVYRRNNNAEEEGEDGEEGERRRAQRPRPGLANFMPLILLTLMYVVPWLFSSKPLYSFEPTQEYYNKRSTSRNNVIYFASDKFITNIESMSTYDFAKTEYSIEKEFVEHLNTVCTHIIRHKNELELKLQYYRSSPYYRSLIERELQKLDYTPCERYYELYAKLQK